MIIESGGESLLIRVVDVSTLSLTQATRNNYHGPMLLGI